ncbi:MAG: anaerobic ribonucleoside-triphosphate reductase [Clostridia bacterium]|nr:anaerobic ribonucleoside-triphosphate reductase [Clostridia bacterium]
MKVIKRDGASVEYDRDKIKIAINKANSKVLEEEQASEVQIKNIIKYIENLNKKRILVEDIQDIIEEKLMAIGKFALAKEYITYRYTRALVRKANTTDESILSLIKNKNANTNSSSYSNSFSFQRDVIASEVSKDLSKRILLPAKIAEAHEKNIIYIHDLEYFMQPIVCASYINIQDMLDKGTVINNIELKIPTSFFDACINLSKILTSLVASNFQGQTIDLTCLGKYLEISKNTIIQNLVPSNSNLLDKESINKQLDFLIASELTNGIDLIVGQLNALSSFNKSITTMNIFLKTDSKDKYFNENKQIIEEFLLQINSKQPSLKDNFPKIIFLLDEFNHYKENTLTNLAIKFVEQGGNLYFLSSKVMLNNYNKIFPPIGTNYFHPVIPGAFNQAKVTINLPQISIIADGNLDSFWNLLDERLEICKEALLCKHHSMLGINSSTSPIHWENGGIFRNSESSKIDSFLKSDASTLTLGYLGLYETSKILEPSESVNLSKEILEYINKKVNSWSIEFGIKFNISGTCDLEICKQFIQNDLEQYGKIKGITDKVCYSQGFEIINKNINTIIQKLQEEVILQNLSLGGSLIILNLDNTSQLNNELLSFIYDNVQFIKIEII